MITDGPNVRRDHDNSDCYQTYGSVDGCPSDCDCQCHSDESLVWMVDELKMRRDC